MLHYLLCRFFWLVGIQDINRSIPYDASTIHGTRDLHSIQTKSFHNVFAFDSRKQSCFCHICIENVESTEVCENITNNYVKAWRHTEINPKGKMPLASVEELESEEIAISSDGDRISDLVREGNDQVQLFCRLFILVHHLIHVY